MATPVKTPPTSAAPSTAPAPAPKENPAVVIDKLNEPPQPPAEVTPPAVDAKPSGPRPAPSINVTGLPDPGTREQRIMDKLMERYSNIKELGDTSFFSHEGVCRKCGWHTMQNDLDSVRTAMAYHVQQHWKDVAMEVR